MQSQTPIYKDTSGIKRFQTNYAQHTPQREAGTALAKALGAFSNVAADQAKQQKAKDLEEGKHLAMMGVQRENIGEAASGQGVFSGVGGWTLQGYDMQRGIEDAFIRHQQLAEDFAASGLSESDDIGAFQSFVDLQREAILAELAEAPEYYREGYLEGIAPAFQKIGRSFAASADTFRGHKKSAAFKDRVRAGLVLGDNESKVLVGNAPKDSGIPTQQAAELAGDVLVEEVRKGTVNIDDVDLKAYKKDTQRRVQEAAAARAEREEAELVAFELESRREIRRLKDRAVSGDTTAWQTLKTEHPEEHDKLLKGTSNAVTPSETHSKRIDTLVKSSPEWATEQMSESILELFEAQQINQDQYVRLTTENNNAVVARQIWQDNAANNFIVVQRAADLQGDQRQIFEDLMDQQISEFIKTEDRQPTASELSSMASDAAQIVKGEL